VTNAERVKILEAVLPKVRLPKGWKVSRLFRNNAVRRRGVLPGTIWFRHDERDGFVLDIVGQFDGRLSFCTIVSVGDIDAGRAREKYKLR